jgi:hypothetical protein
MAINYETDDSGSIFWPGYVDAVVNLAINLLFVIAVMSIVVLGITLQISTPPEKKTPTPESPIASQDILRALKEVEQLLSKTEKAKTVADKTIVEKDKALQVVKEELRETKITLQDVRARLTQLQASHAETIQAAENRARAIGDISSGRVAIIRSMPAGVMVVFPQDSKELSASENASVISKMGVVAPVASSAWRISVVYPRAVGDAAKVAAERAHTISQLLARNGVPSSAIEMRLIESEQVTANNARVIISVIR